MITPKFEVSQNNECIIVSIYCPMAKLSEAEISITDDTFIFAGSPYYLRLSFSGKLIDSELERHRVTYDADKTLLQVSCIKETVGEEFQNLQMLTSLLTPKQSKIEPPHIEVLDGHMPSEDYEVSWFLEQTLSGGDEMCCKYGFLNAYGGSPDRLQNELAGVIDIVDPENKPVSQRRMERILKENEDFSEDHYLADYFDDSEAQSCMDFIPYFYKDSENIDDLSSQDREDMLRLSRKEFLVDPASAKYLYMGLVDILYAWCFNFRITHSEECTEAGWNITKISPTLSWFDRFLDLKDVLVACVRRALVYPLVRNWKFSVSALEDVRKVLSRGKIQVLRCLLDVRRILEVSDQRFVLNRLYVNDYCVWIQTVSDANLVSLSASIEKVSLLPDDVDLDLSELVQAAHMVLEEDRERQETRLADVSRRMEALTVRASGQAEDATDDGSSRSEDDSSGSSSSSSSSLDSDDDPDS